MKNKGNLNSLVMGISYTYLCVPMIIFLLGWCRWYIGLSASALIVYCVVKCVKEHMEWKPFKLLYGRYDGWKILVALMLIMAWVWLSGIGKFVWQNSDHTCRNTMYELLVAHKWPVRGNYELQGMLQSRGMVYYIGFWLPAALFGKVFGMQAGYVTQYIWAVIGIFLLYLLLCIWRKKVLVWPLLLFALFSGLDIVGTFLHFDSSFNIWGTEHLERWPGSYQFSGITTQLFWVFNQAVPAWIASIIIFLYEKPKNIVFVCSLIMITSTFPFVGLLPYTLYNMVVRSDLGKSRTVWDAVKNAVQNVCSIQNVLGGGCVGIISFFYLIGNISGGQTNLQTEIISRNVWQMLFLGMIVVVVLVLVSWLMIWAYLKGYKKMVLTVLKVFLMVICAFCVMKYLNRIDGIEAQFRRMTILIVFYFLEAGIFMIPLYNKVEDKGIFWLNAIWLLIIPNIIVGQSIDFCMRASIPGLILIILWCIEMLDRYRGEACSRFLIVVLAVGSITSLHEIHRTIVNTVQHEQIVNATEEEIMTAGNFSGNTESFFWRYIAR